MHQAPRQLSNRSGQPTTRSEDLQRLLAQGIVRLDFGGCSFGHFRTSQSYVERIGRVLLARHDPAGAIWLAYYLRCWGYSYADKALKNAHAFSADLYTRYLPRLIAKPSKTGFDCFTLGLEYQRGNKTGRSLALSRQLFRRAMAKGFSLATHELIMSTMVDDTLPETEKLRCFSLRRGRAAKDTVQARDIFILSSQRVDAVPDPHAWMRQLLAAWKREVYSTIGKQYLNLRVESCIKGYVEYMRARSDLVAEDFVMLAKVAESSRVASLGSKPFEFYRKAALLGHLEAAEWYVRLTPETERESIEAIIRQGFGAIPPQVEGVIRDKFEDY